MPTGPEWVQVIIPVPDFTNGTWSKGWFKMLHIITSCTAVGRGMSNCLWTGDLGGRALARAKRAYKEQYKRACWAAYSRLLRLGIA